MVSELEIQPEAWSDFYLLKAKVNMASAPHLRFMNLTRLQNALGHFRIPNRCSAETSVGAWNVMFLDTMNKVFSSITTSTSGT